MKSCTVAIVQVSAEPVVTLKHILRIILSSLLDNFQIPSTE